jgi:hypothetical protein
LLTREKKSLGNSYKTNINVKTAVWKLRFWTAFSIPLRILREGAAEPPEIVAISEASGNGELFYGAAEPREKQCVRFSRISNAAFLGRRVPDVSRLAIFSGSSAANASAGLFADGFLTFSRYVNNKYQHEIVGGRRPPS